MRSKGKREAFLCGRLHDGHAGFVATRAKATRLDRDATAANAEWAELMRGDILIAEPDLSADRTRIGKETTIGRVESH